MKKLGWLLAFPLFPAVVIIDVLVAPDRPTWRQSVADAMREWRRLYREA